MNNVVLRHRFHPLDPRLGRHIAHDHRSFAFPAEEAEIKSVRHERLVPIFNQGHVGSCTGNAMAGCLSTAPFGQHFTEADAVAIYSQATRIDPIPGVYPPDDTGSTGLSVMKVCKSSGWISGYGHAFGVTHALGALQRVPGICGMSWLTGCDEPNAEGIIRYKGSVRGGHEVELVGCDTVAKLVWFANSWGTDWGKDGYFAMSWDDFSTALSGYGDVTFPKAP